MKAIVCEMCNSTDIVKQDGFYVCQSCGTKYSVEEAKKLMIDGPVDVSGSTVKVDNSDSIEKYLQLARRAREAENSENAEKYYALVLQEDPNNWEAAFFQVYYRAMQCKIGEIEKAAYSVANNLDGTLILIKKYVTNEAERNEALETVINRASNISSSLSIAAMDHYREFSSVKGADEECNRRKLAADSIIFALENSFRKHFSGDSAHLVEILKQENYNYSCGIHYNKAYRTEQIKRLTGEIQAIEPTYTPPQMISSSGCYVATAVYGSYDCPEVWTLRRYRDDTLAQTWYGRAFIHTYYAISPTLVKWFGDAQWFKNMWKPKLDRMVLRLNQEGVESTPYQDKNW